MEPNTTPSTNHAFLKSRVVISFDVEYDALKRSSYDVSMLALMNARRAVEQAEHMRVLGGLTKEQASIEFTGEEPLKEEEHKTLLLLEVSYNPENSFKPDEVTAELVKAAIVDFTNHEFSSSNVLTGVREL